VRVLERIGLIDMERGEEDLREAVVTLADRGVQVHAMKYTLFGKTGLRVSQLALGTGNFGTGWGHGAERGDSEAIFNAYAETGGNPSILRISTRFGQSEEVLGSLLEGRALR
jgi:hypothetical protein